MAKDQAANQVLTFRKLPWWVPMGGLTIGHTIFLKHLGESGYDYMIVHEKAHVAQQERDGLWRFMLRYVFSPWWRVEYEADACAAEIVSGWYTPKISAEDIASWRYLWPCKALHAFDRITYYVSKRKGLVP